MGLGSGLRTLAAGRSRLERIILGAGLRNRTDAVGCDPLGEVAPPSASKGENTINAKVEKVAKVAKLLAGKQPQRRGRRGTAEDCNGNGNRFWRNGFSGRVARAAEKIPPPQNLFLFLGDLCVDAVLRSPS